MLQILVSLIYETVRHSWLVAAFSIKFLVVALIARLAYEDRLDIESLEEIVLSYARETVAGIVVLGAGVAASGVELPLFPRILSELVAVGYFAFLFWRY